MILDFNDYSTILVFFNKKQKHKKFQKNNTKKTASLNMYLFKCTT